MMLIAILVAASVVYSTMAGAMWDIVRTADEDGDEGVAGFICIIWPISMVCYLGFKGSQALRDRSKPNTIPKAKVL